MVPRVTQIRGSPLYLESLKWKPFCLVDAEFLIPTTGGVAENETLPVCINMTTTPPRGILFKEVVLSLFTVDGTGIIDCVA